MSHRRLPPGESLCKSFQEQLAELGVDWFPGIEASSTDLIETYVGNGFGIGVSISIPGKSPPSNVRTLPLNGFPPVVIGALWRGSKTPLIEMFLDEAKSRVKRLGRENSV